MISAIILAAGQSTRMGKPKLTLPIGGEPVLARVLRAFRRSKVDTVVVVLGGHEDSVRQSVKFGSERLVVNPNYGRGMGGSIKLGLKEVGPEVDAVIIALGDQPFLTTRTIDRLVEAYERGAQIAVPVYHGTRGNPVLFSKRFIPEVGRISGDRGAKSVLQRNKSDVREVTVDDVGVRLDVDTPGDYAAAKERVSITRRKRIPEGT